MPIHTPSDEYHIYDGDGDDFAEVIFYYIFLVFAKATERAEKRVAKQFHAETRSYVFIAREHTFSGYYYYCCRACCMLFGTDNVRSENK